MNDLALGWTDADARPPAPLRLRGQGPVRLITAPAPEADTPRQRLELLQQCFDAGLDLIPLAVADRNSADLAETCPTGLPAQLAALRGCGQLSLTLTWQAAPSTARQITGQSWLHQRHRQRAEAAALGQLAVSALLTLADCLPCRQNPPKLAAGGCSLDLLVPRSELGAIQSRISSLSQSLAVELLPNAALLVTGLWPPYTFVQPATQQIPA